MGLDMYLDKHIYYGGKYKKEHDLVLSGDFADKNGLSGTDVSEIVQQVAYWRKANAIHGWFVQNVQDGVDNCQRHYVSVEQLTSLVKLCKEALECLNNKDFDGVYTLMPPTEGFFFGEYNVESEWYRQELEETISMVETALEKPGDTYYYCSSW